MRRFSISVFQYTLLLEFKQKYRETHTSLPMVVSKSWMLHLDATYSMKNELIVSLTMAVTENQKQFSIISWITNYCRTNTDKVMLIDV